jgi:hypothetical protein
MKLSLPPKLVEKLVQVPGISFCKISFPVMHLVAYYAETGRPLIAKSFKACSSSAHVPHVFSHPEGVREY